MPKTWIKNVALFLGSQAVSHFGSSLVQYAIMWHITLVTKSGLMMTVSIICGFVPAFFLSPFAGVWADRYNRKLIIIIADSFIALATLALAILFMFGHNYIWLLFIVMAMRSIGSGIQGPAVGAIIPQFVPKTNLRKVNGINSSINSVILLLSPMLAAFLLAFASIESIFFIDVFTALFAVIIFIFFIKIPTHAKALDRKAKSYLQDLKEGINYIRTHRYIRNFIVFCLFFYFLIAPVTFLTPLQVVRNYGPEVWRLTAIEIAFSIGMMMGGLIVGYFKVFKNKINLMAFAFSITGLTTFLLGFTIFFWFYCTVIIMMGLAVPLFHTTSTVLIQEKVEEEYLGRVFGILAMISTSMVPLGMIVFGPIADFVSIDTILIITGLIIIALSFALSKNKTLLSEGK